MTWNLPWSKDWKNDWDQKWNRRKPITVCCIYLHPLPGRPSSRLAESWTLLDIPTVDHKCMKRSRLTCRRLVSFLILYFLEVLVRPVQLHIDIYYLSFLPRKGISIEMNLWIGYIRWDSRSSTRWISPGYIGSFRDLIRTHRSLPCVVPFG